MLVGRTVFAGLQAGFRCRLTGVKNMKVVILAGGYGTRISEESKFKPKPMIEIGGMPILWHIMKEYSYYGFNDFVICAGYKQHMIKEWFADYFLHTSDVTFDFTQGNEMIVHDQHAEPWRVTVVDTGLNTMTGGRIKRVQKYIGIVQLPRHAQGVVFGAIIHKNDLKFCAVALFHLCRHTGRFLIKQRHGFFFVITWNDQADQH